MEVIEIHTQAENGHVSFDLPAEYAGLRNARLRVTVEPEPTTSPPAPSTPVGTTDWEALQRALDGFKGHDPYPTITDAVAWQREMRANDEKQYDR